MRDPERIRVVVGEGRAQRHGLLGFVLEGEGMQVVATATTTGELAESLAEHRPDVVVLDDGMGSIAVSMTRRMVPGAKVVLVWPRGVVAIDGDASVEPSEVLRELGATVDRLMSAPARPMRAQDRPLPRHPSVTELRRRGERLHPSSGMRPSRWLEPGRSPERSDPASADREPAPVVMLRAPKPAAEVGASASTREEGEPVVMIPEAPDRWSRRRVAIGAAVVTAVCLLLVGLVFGYARSSPLSHANDLRRGPGSSAEGPGDVSRAAGSRTAVPLSFVVGTGDTSQAGRGALRASSDRGGSRPPATSRRPAGTGRRGSGGGSRGGTNAGSVGAPPSHRDAAAARSDVHRSTATRLDHPA